MLIFSVLMIVSAFLLAGFAFATPQNRKGLEDVLFVGGVFGVLAIAMCGVFFQDEGPWTLRLVARFAAVMVGSFLPYIGYKLGNYCGYRYEGR